MKKIFCVFISFLITLLPLVCLSYASTEININTIEYFEDGTYVVIDICDVTKNENADMFEKIFEFFRKIIEFLTGNKTVSKTKYASYYDSKGNLLWTVYLNADFSYNGKTSLCKSTSVTSDMYDGDWTVLSAVSEKSANTAFAEFSVQQSKLGVKLKTVNKQLTLICDKDGNIY